MSTPEFIDKAELSSFDEVDRAATFPPLEKSCDTEVVVLGVKKLRTGKEVRTILPEERYVGGLQKIIERDYFPELAKLKAQNEYLDALASNDLPKIRELQRRYSTKRTERRTSPTANRRSPDAFEQDTPVASNGEYKLPSSARTLPSDRFRDESNTTSAQLTVDAYLSKYTSEDNASFEELTTLHHKMELVRNAWMYDAEKKHNTELIMRAQPLADAADEQLMIAAAPESAEKKPKDVDNWLYKARSAVHFHLNEAPLTLEEHLQRQKMNERVINKVATRFSEKTNRDLQRNSASNAAMHYNAAQGKIDITGREMGVNKDVQMNLVSTPSPAPGVDDSPFMTWGEIEGTPFRLDGSDIGTPSSAPAFKIPDVPVREKIAQGIAEVIAKRYHNKRKAAIREVEKHHVKTPTFGSARNSDKLLQMSPAARRLATKGLGIRLSSAKDMKSGYYTPSPLRTPSSRRSSGFSAVVIQKSQKNLSADKQKKGKAPVLDVTPSITDNLLDFGEIANPDKKGRPSASDFF